LGKALLSKYSTRRRHDPGRDGLRTGADRASQPDNEAFVVKKFIEPALAMK
jgi:hypothetical protein